MKVKAKAISEKKNQKWTDRPSNIVCLSVEIEPNVGADSDQRESTNSQQVKLEHNYAMDVWI